MTHPVRFVGLDTPGAGGTLRPVLEPLRAFPHRAVLDVVGLADTTQDIAGRFESLPSGMIEHLGGDFD